MCNADFHLAVSPTIKTPGGDAPVPVSTAVPPSGPERPPCRSPTPSHWSIRRSPFPAVNSSPPDGEIVGSVL